MTVAFPDGRGAGGARRMRSRNAHERSIAMRPFLTAGGHRGVAALGLVALVGWPAAFACAADAAGGPVEPLHAFHGVHHGPSAPTGVLLSASDGALYGLTAHGGPYDDGTVFRIEPDGSYATVATFTPIEGAQPVGGLVELDGVFYGVTDNGGEHGIGSIYALNPDGSKRIVFSFDPGWGGHPTSGLLRAADGSLYGLLFSLVYRIDPAGDFFPIVDLYDGANSFDIPMVQGADGALYVQQDGSRTILERVGLEGRVSTIYEYTYPEYPIAMTVGTDGDFYETSFIANDDTACLVFSRIDLKGHREILGKFPCNPMEYVLPGLVEGTDGRFHGALTFQGSDSKTHDALFSLGLDGTIETENMPRRAGKSPGTLTQGPDGAFYGIGAEGGRYGNGTVFRALAMP
jgi:uncharacterized repeat protein (TIGR03803 family)